MLNAEQHKRQFLARTISMLYLLLLLVVFGGDRAICSYDRSSTETTTVSGYTDDLAEVMLPSQVSYADDLQASAKQHKPTGIFSSGISNHFYTHQWKQYTTDFLTVEATPLKRYLLFSCLRLSKAPLLLA